MISGLGIGVGTLIIFLMMISLLFIGMPLGFFNRLNCFSDFYLWFDTAAIMQMVAARVTDFNLLIHLLQYQCRIDGNVTGQNRYST